MRSVVMMTLLASCASDISADPDCRRSAECDQAFCIGGRCQSFTGPTMDASPARPDQPSVSDSTSRSICSDALPPNEQTLALNELLANVPAGDEGDANGDGIRDAYEDEFVELVNISAGTVDLTGVRVLSAGKLKHTFEPLCLAPGDAIVVFGGGSVGPTVDGNALISDRRLSLSNDDGDVSIVAPAGVVDHFSWGSSPAASFTRVPQLTGQTWVSHLEVSALPYSPGRCPDGSHIRTGCVSK